MLILFLHGWQSTTGVKPTYLKNHGHEVFNPALPDDDFDAAVVIAQAEFDLHHLAQYGWFLSPIRPLLRHFSDNRRSPSPFYPFDPRLLRLQFIRLLQALNFHSTNQTLVDLDAIVSQQGDHVPATGLPS